MHTGPAYSGGWGGAKGGVIYNSSEFLYEGDILFFFGVATVKVICPYGGGSVWYTPKRKGGLSNTF